MTVLARDGSQCMALVDDARHLDEALADPSGKDTAAEMESSLSGASSRDAGPQGAG